MIRKILAGLFKLDRISDRDRQILTALQQGEMAGINIGRSIGIRLGELYPRLHKLETFGFVSARWSEVGSSVRGNERRRLYKLTNRGQLEARLNG